MIARVPCVTERDFENGPLRRAITQELADDVLALSERHPRNYFVVHCEEVDGFQFQAMADGGDIWCRHHAEYRFVKTVRLFAPPSHHLSPLRNKEGCEWSLFDLSELNILLGKHATTRAENALWKAIGITSSLGAFERNTSKLATKAEQLTQSLIEQQQALAEAKSDFYRTASQISRPSPEESSLSPGDFYPSLNPPPLAAYEHLAVAQDKYRGLSGIYFASRRGVLVYIGKSIDIGTRWRSHHKIKHGDKVAVVPVDEKMLTLAEQNLIHRFMPMLNKEWDFEYTHGSLVGFCPLLRSENGHPTLQRWSLKSKAGKEASCP
jgi:hypothetical protein